MAVGLVACRAQRTEFCNEVFACDLHAAKDPCGKSCAGKPMTCVAGSQLGGTDFCAEACDPAHGSDDPHFTCLSSGALLQKCQPVAGATDPSKGCPAGLQCYRTDLLSDEGICVAMHVCATDSDCAGAQRNVCASTLLRQMNPGLPNVDSLECLQGTCATSGTACLSGESCLADYYQVGLGGDICVPNCENQHCPPNFTCAAVSSGAGSPAICIPGLPGSRCVSDQDCLIGSCFDTGAGISECVPPVQCRTDVDCVAFSNPDAVFMCGTNMQTGQRACISATPFHGANCNESTDIPQGQCPADQKCYRYSPFVADQRHGECRIPCDVDRHCPALAGIPHICLDDGAGGCYPSQFALPCVTTADCLAGFACTNVSPDERTVITSPTICTVECVTDDDCLNNPQIQRLGFCKEGLCRMRGALTAPCDRDAQCRVGVCLLDASGQGQCTD
jgi:hypothetical protein